MNLQYLANGNLEDSFDNGDITEEQYNYYVKMGL